MLTTKATQNVLFLVIEIRTSGKQLQPRWVLSKWSLLTAMHHNSPQKLLFSTTQLNLHSASTVYLNLTTYPIHLHSFRGTLGTREGYLIFTGFVSSRPNEQLTSQYFYRLNMGRIAMMPPCCRPPTCPSGAAKAAHQHLNASFMAMTPYLQISLID